MARALIESVWATGSVPVEHFTYWGAVAGAAARLHPAGRHLTNPEFRRAIVALVEIGWLETEQVGRGNGLAVRPTEQFAHRHFVEVPDVEVRPRHNRRRIVDEARAAQREWIERATGRCPATSEPVTAAKAMPRRQRGDGFSMPLSVAMERASRRGEAATEPFNKRVIWGTNGDGGNRSKYYEGFNALVHYGYVEQVAKHSYRVVQPYRVVPAYIPNSGEPPWWECIEPQDRYAKHGPTSAVVLSRNGDSYLARIRRERSRRLAGS